MDFPIARALVSEEVQTLVELFGSEQDALALQTKLRNFLPPKIAQAATELVDLRQRGRGKFTRSNQMYFTRDGLEVASNEVISRYRAKRLEGKGLVYDACCGMGGDLIPLAEQGPVMASDRVPGLTILARANVEAYGAQVERIFASDVTLVQPPADVLFLDPARRTGRKRSRGPEEWSPGLDSYTDLVKRYGNVCLKTSPAVEPEDILSNELTYEAEFVSYRGECKEQVVWFGDLITTRRRATIVTDEEHITLEGDPADTDELDVVEPEVEGWIFEPDPALVRSGLLAQVGAAHALKLIDPEIAFLVGADHVDSPFVRKFQIVAIEKMDERKVRALLRKREIGKLTVKKRGHPSDAESLRRKLSQGMKGRKSGTLIVTRRGDDHFALLVEPHD
ncbi:MAG: hypothetical protein H6834_10425 [Planctomycetes bacterium]|nr:hypothetical protein [Planctomycetota bacterium]